MQEVQANNPLLELWIMSDRSLNKSVNISLLLTLQGRHLDQALIHWQFILVKNLIYSGITKSNKAIHETVLYQGILF